MLFHQVRIASSLNFRNSEPPASFKTLRISSLIDSAESNNDMGSSLVNEADEFLKSSTGAYDKLNDQRDSMESTMANANQDLSDELNAIIQNDVRL
jgi:hypothetical protein